MPITSLKKAPGLLYGTAQLLRADFQCLLACSQQAGVAKGISPCGEDDMQLRRQMLSPDRRGACAPALGDQLIVIQDQHKVIRALCQQIDPALSGGLERWWLR